MVKHFIAGISLLLLSSVSFAQSTPSIAATNKGIVHTLTLDALQTEADTVGISDVFDRVADRVTNIRYDVPTGRIFLMTEASLKTKDIMELLLTAGYTSYYINPEGKKIVMLPSGKMETWEAK